MIIRLTTPIIINPTVHIIIYYTCTVYRLSSLEFEVLIDNQKRSPNIILQCSNCSIGFLIQATNPTKENEVM